MNETQVITDSKLSDLIGKYLTFSLGNEKYGIGILTVQEIIGVSKITPIPNSPNYLKGVINLRGKIIPVFDLRLKFNMPQRAYDNRTCFIVVNTVIGEQNIALGIVVDTVVEVLHFDDKNLELAPDFGSSLKVPFIRGLGKSSSSSDEVTTILDIDRVLKGDKDFLVAS